jgi:oxygen-independent coproporphyrinogen-3 oxidase
MDEGLDDKQILEVLMNLYCITRDKAELLIQVSRCERPFINENLDKISLYIGIPFCPSICSYCSFPSNDINKKTKLVTPYVDRLIEEIEAVFEHVTQYNRKIDVVYIGGGTPTSIPLNEFKRIIDTLKKGLDLSQLKEFTVEAGRPDAMGSDMLELLKRNHVSRICLNPQSLDNQVLINIGRKHTGEDVIEKMQLLREFNFNQINMDLIVGLPGDSIDTFSKTLRQVIEMAPENITVHTLAIKKGSRMKTEAQPQHLTSAESISQMLNLVETSMYESGYHPYYLYRQKNILGNFENIGYAKSGQDSIYNIRIIEERHPILALGVGGVSKAVIPGTETFERIPNFRSLEEYIHRFDEMLERKARFFNLTQRQ